MEKSLEEMTNEELWQLFPIILKEHNPIWKENYLLEKRKLEAVIGNGNILRISHYGSTSIPNLIAKPTIDILLEIKGSMDVDKLIEIMQVNGYIYSGRPNNPTPPYDVYEGLYDSGIYRTSFSRAC